MTLKEIKEKFPNGKGRIFNGKRIYYMNPYDLRNNLSREDYNKIIGWNGICIYSSPKGKKNKCFYFYWGFGGTPDDLIEIEILA